MAPSYRLRRGPQERPLSYQTNALDALRTAAATWRKTCITSIASTRPPRFKRGRDDEPSAMETTMIPSRSSDSLSIGLDDESWKMLPGSQVNYLLNIFSLAEDDSERTYTSVSIFPPADGRDLYVKPH